MKPVYTTCSAPTSTQSIVAEESWRPKQKNVKNIAKTDENLPTFQLQQIKSL